MTHGYSHKFNDSLMFSDTQLIHQSSSFLPLFQLMSIQHGNKSTRGSLRSESFALLFSDTMMSKKIFFITAASRAG